MMRTLTKSMLATGLLIACGGTPGITPMLGINSPSDNSTVNVSLSKLIAVNFSTNYTLRGIGECAGQNNCGHVYLLVDSSNCNQPNLPYNALALSSPVQADLGRCATLQGMHTITLELHQDDGTVVHDLLGRPVATKVTITAQAQ